MVMAPKDPYGRMFDLSGRVALVTGGGRGIGRGVVLALARQGADVAIGCVGRPDAAEETKALVEKLGRRCIVVQADVADPGAARRMVDDVVRAMGGLDVLVNNAGILSFEPFVDMKVETWDRVMDVNLKGQFLVAQAAAREMIRRGRGGRIVNVASIGSGGVGVGFPGIAHYTASKGGVVALTETMAVELAPHGILVNAVAPGFIETDMSAGTRGNEAALQATLARIPLRRPGRPEEVGAVVAFLASDEASYCTGGTLYVDGGWLAE